MLPRQTRYFDVNPSKRKREVEEESISFSHRCFKRTTLMESGSWPDQHFDNPPVLPSSYGVGPSPLEPSLKRKNGGRSRSSTKSRHHSPIAPWPSAQRFEAEVDRLIAILEKANEDSNEEHGVVGSVAIFSEVSTLCSDMGKLYYDEGAGHTRQALSLLRVAHQSSMFDAQQKRSLRSWLEMASLVVPETFVDGVSELERRVNLLVPGQINEARILFDRIQCTATTLKNDGFESLEAARATSSLLKTALARPFTANQCGKFHVWLNTAMETQKFASGIDQLPADFEEVRQWLKVLKNDLDIRKRVKLPTRVLTELIHLIPEMAENKVQKIIYGLVQKAYKKCEKSRGTEEIQSFVEKLLESAVNCHQFTDAQEKELQQWYANTQTFREADAPTAQAPAEQIALLDLLSLKEKLKAARVEDDVSAILSSISRYVSSLERDTANKHTLTMLFSLVDIIMLRFRSNRYVNDTIDQILLAGEENSAFTEKQRKQFGEWRKQMCKPNIVAAFIEE